MYRSVNDMTVSACTFKLKKDLSLFPTPFLKLEFLL